MTRLRASFAEPPAEWRPLRRDEHELEPTAGSRAVEIAIDARQGPHGRDGFVDWQALPDHFAGGKPQQETLRP